MMKLRKDHEDFAKDLIKKAVSGLLVFGVSAALLFVSVIDIWIRVAAAALLIAVLVQAWILIDKAQTTSSATPKRAAIGVTLLATVALLTVGYLNRPPKRNFALASTLILLDTSAEMAASMSDGMSKMAAAQLSLGDHVRDLANDQLGLASFGYADCRTDPPIQEVVGVAQKRAKRIAREAAALSVNDSGERNLVSAGITSIGLLNRFTDFTRVLIITGGLDTCGRELEALWKEFQDKDVTDQLEVIGLDVSLEDQEALLEVFEGVTLRFAATVQEALSAIEVSLSQPASAFVGSRCRNADLATLDLSVIDLSGADCTGAFVSDAGLDLSGHDLTGTRFGSAVLGGVDFSGARLRGADLSGANLVGADLSGAVLVGADLTDADLGGADLDGANIANASFGNTNLSSVDLTSVDFSGVDFSTADLGSTNLSGLDLSGVDLSGFLLVGADLSGANLVGADLVGADLSGAVLSGADLTDADLEEADLEGADLTAAVVSSATFEEVDLTGVDLSGIVIVTSGSVTPIASVNLDGDAAG